MKNYKFIKQLQLLPWVDALWLFGSRARSDHEARADIDLAVLCPTATDPEWLEISTIIENADTLLKIDCVRFDKLPTDSQLSRNIMKDKKVIYERQNKN